jgi:hypothetical protein
MPTFFSLGQQSGPFYASIPHQKLIPGFRNRLLGSNSTVSLYYYGGPADGDLHGILRADFEGPQFRATLLRAEEAEASARGESGTCMSRAARLSGRSRSGEQMLGAARVLLALETSEIRKIQRSQEIGAAERHKKKSHSSVLPIGLLMVAATV